MSVIFAIFIFSFLIFIHEFGHFITAKLSGVQVNEFSMFMGPAIWKKQVGETLYALRCIPIGGYCAMEGEDEDTENPRSFQKAAWWKRLIILVAGSAMNLIAGFLIVAIVNSFTAAPIPQVDSLRTGSALACEGGLMVNDEILELGGYAVETTTDFNEILQRDPSVTEYDILIRRNGQELLLEDVPMVRKEFPANSEGEAGLFYGINWRTRSLTFPEVLKQSFHDCVYFGKLVWMSLGMIFSGEAGLQDMAGPVGIVSMMSDTVSASDSTASAILSLLFFGAFIAVNLGLMNLLPIPALDGGRVFFLIVTWMIEKIIRRRLDPKYEGYVHSAGFVLLMGLMVFVMFSDVLREFFGI